MTDNDLQILRALTELKNQLQEARGILTSADTEPTTVNSSEEQPDEYTAKITPEEIDALLSSFSNEETSISSVEESSPEELEELKNEFLEFKGKTTVEIKSIQDSINILSEMWGRHEMEIRKAAAEKTRT